MKKLSKFVTILLLSAVILVSPSLPLLDNAGTVSDSGTIVPYSDIIDWVYRLDNDMLYKRLYNFTTQEFIGYWIYVG